MDIMDIAANIRKTRQAMNLTLAALATRTGVTKGYLSQVENMRTLVSLPVLYKIAAALGVEPGALLAGGKPAKRYVHTPHGRGEVVEREYPESGFIYRALAADKTAKRMEPFLLELPPRSSRKDVTTNGDEFIYVISGRVEFVIDKDRIPLAAGDSLYFEGSIPHHPENNTNRKAVLLVVYSLSETVP